VLTEQRVSHFCVSVCVCVCMCVHVCVCVWSLQTEACMGLLKQLSPAETEAVLERLTTWARLQLEDKEHVSDEVSTFLLCFFST